MTASVPELLGMMVRHLPDAALLVDQTGRIVQANRLAEQMFGYAAGELNAASLELLIPEANRATHGEQVRKFMQAPVERLRGSGLNLYGRRKDGTLFPADVTLGPIREGDTLTVLATVRDVSHQRQAEEALLQTNRALRLLSASNQTLIRSGNEDDLLAQVCRIAVEVGGYRLAWIGFKEHDAEKTVRPVAWVGYEDGFMSAARMSWAEGERGTSAMATAIRTGTVQLRQDILNDPQLAPWHDDARKRNYQSAVALPLTVNDEVIGAIAIYAPEPDAFHEQEIALLRELADDLSFGIQSVRLRDSHYKAQAHVHQLAYYDRLTGLPNRILFLEHLTEVLHDAAVSGHQITLLLLDLDHLREINETHGHSVGDQLLVKVGWQLQQICGPERFVSRFGGDDFAIIYPGASQDEAIGLANNILATISLPTRLGEYQFSIGGNIGIASYPDDAETPQELMSQVDLAMSRAKEADGGYRFYRAEMSQVLARRLELAHRLELALNGSGLQLYYQPKVDLVTGQLRGAEALLRWHDPQLGWVSPAEFIPVAEQRGMMVRLGEWVLREACRQVRVWLDAGLSCQGRLAVNISSKQLDDPNFIPLLAGIVVEQDVPPACLELELTESALMNDPEQVVGILTELKQRGFSLAIDDFGTGYSSLVYLKRFPMDTLKVDQTFVRDMLVDQNDHAIIATISAMAQQLGLTLVAEGVELEGQRQALQALGCGIAQGFYFSRPIPAEEFTVKRLAAPASPLP